MTRRAYNLSLLTVFDQPLVATNCLKRDASAVPLQSLVMLNDAFVAEAGRALRQPGRTAAAEPARTANRSTAFRAGARPTAQRRRDGPRAANCWPADRALPRRRARRADVAAHQALVQLCHTLLNTSEFLYVGMNASPIAEARPGTAAAQFLEQATLGFGTLALAHLLEQDGAGCARGDRAVPAASTCARGPAIFRRGPTSVIMLMQVGGPSQIDLFDPKPELQKRDGQEHPGDVETLQPGSETQEADGQPVPLPRARPVRHGDLRAAAARSARWPTSSAWSARCTATTTIIRRRRAA